MDPSKEEEMSRELGTTDQQAGFKRLEVGIAFGASDTKAPHSKA